MTSYLAFSKIKKLVPEDYIITEECPFGNNADVYFAIDS